VILSHTKAQRKGAEEVKANTEKFMALKQKKAEAFQSSCLCLNGNSQMFIF